MLEINQLFLPALPKNITYYFYFILISLPIYLSSSLRHPIILKLCLWVSYNSQNYACKYQMNQCYTECINATECINSTVQCIMLQCISAAECMHQYNNATECINATVHDYYSVMMLQSVKILQCNYCIVTI